MSVENLDGDGLADQPSVIYGYTDDQDELHIKELSRSGYGEPGPSSGDVISRESTKSTLKDGLPELPPSGQDGLQRDDCGEDIPAFACEDCGSPMVDADGHMVVPREPRQALTIDEREALVEFTVKKVASLDEEDGGDGSE